MAAQSKLLPPDRPIRQILANLSALYLRNRKHISRAVYLTLFIALVKRIHNAISEQKAASERQVELRKMPGTSSLGDSGTSNRRRNKVEVNREFFTKLLRLLKIVIPGLRSKELRMIVSQSVFLVMRTLLSLYVAELDGRLVSNLVRGKGRDFLLGLVWWMIVAVPATFTNSMVSAVGLLGFEDCVGLTGLLLALISSVQARTQLPKASYRLYTRKIFDQYDVLCDFGPGRSDQEPRSTRHGRCVALL